MLACVKFECCKKRVLDVVGGFAGKEISREEGNYSLIPSSTMLLAGEFGGVFWFLIWLRLIVLVCLVV